MHRVKGGLEAERAERVRCKQEDMERERRNFEAMQVSITAIAHFAQIVAAVTIRPCARSSLRGQGGAWRG